MDELKDRELKGMAVSVDDTSSDYDPFTNGLYITGLTKEQIETFGLFLNELYQKIREQSKPKKGHQKIELFSKIRKLFSKKDNSSMFPLVKSEEKFKPRETAKEIQEKETKDFRKKESLSDFILARKPKFTSIKTELISSKQEQSLAKKLFEHIRRAESHLERKNHEKAHENF